MAEVSIPVKVGSYWTNIIANYTGESVNFEEVSLWHDGTAMDDSKADGVIYRKLPMSVGGGYVKRVYTDKINVKWFGAKGDDLTDDTSSIGAAISMASKLTPITLYFPTGVYRYGNIGNLNYSDLTLEGEGDRSTTLRCMGTGIALSVNAFPILDDPNQPFLNNFSLKNIVIQGNEDISTILFIQGLARSTWENVWVKDANAASGIGIDMAGAQLCAFKNMGCSTQATLMDSVPYEGLRMRGGNRAGTSVGACSNNTYYQNYYEGLSIGVRLAQGDQNFFIGGSPEACSVYGVLVGQLSRYNTFISVAFENLGAVDVSDGGTYNRYINCYASSNFRVGSTAVGISFESGFGERFEIQSGAVNTSLKDITYNHWNSGAGGISDLGTNTYRNNLYNADSGLYDKNSLVLDGQITANNIRTKSVAAATDPVNSINSTGGLVGMTVTGADPGVAISVDRTSELTSANSIGSYRLFSRSDTGEGIFVSKKIGVAGSAADWTPLRRVVLENTLASPTQKGVVNQAAASANTAANPGATYSQTEVQAILTELRDLKTKMRTAGLLVP